MAAPNVWLRDPLLYRIRHAPHHHAGDAWCIYPLYDYAHCLSDATERISHSICTLEFEVHRPLYDWIVDNLPVPQPRPHQYEFAKLIPNHMVVSKRKLITLFKEGLVTGWDDPRMPTISGIRRRGVTAKRSARLPSAWGSQSSAQSRTSLSSSTPSVKT
jgi:glutaminyl-tRNA synthetase